MSQTDHLGCIRFWLAAFSAGLVLRGRHSISPSVRPPLTCSFLHLGSLQPMAESTGLLPGSSMSTSCDAQQTPLSIPCVRNRLARNLLTSSSPLPLSVRMQEVVGNWSNAL